MTKKVKEAVPIQHITKDSKLTWSRDHQTGLYTIIDENNNTVGDGKFSTLPDVSNEINRIMKGLN